MEYIDIINKRLLLNSIYKLNEFDTNKHRLMSLCKEIGSYQLYDNLIMSLDDIIFHLMLNALSEEYQYFLRLGKIKGNDYLERSNYFLEYLSKTENINIFFNKYPILKDKVDKKIRNFIVFNSEILKHLIDDKEKILDKIQVSKFQVKNILETGGDSHNGNFIYWKIKTTNPF